VLFERKKKKKKKLAQKRNFFSSFCLTTSTTTTTKMASGVGDKFKNIDWKDVGDKAKQVGFFVVWSLRRIVERIRTHENFSKKAAGSSVLLSFALGITFGLGFALYWLSPIYDLGVFLVFWSFFHLFEWIFVAITSPKELSADCKVLIFRLSKHSS